MAKKKRVPTPPWEKIDSKLKKSHKLGIFFGTILLLGVAFYFLMYQPAQEEMLAINENLDKLQGQILKHRKTAKELPQVKERLALVRLEFEFARTLLPDTKEVPQLLKDISDNGSQAGLNVTLFQPQLRDTIKDFYAEITFDMQVEGPYLNLASFFYRIGRLPRIVNIQDINTGNPRMIEGDMILTTSCKGVTFRFLTPEEIKAQEEAKAAEQKTKRPKK